VSCFFVLIQLDKSLIYLQLVWRQLTVEVDMDRFWKGFFSILLVFLIAGCGSGGTSGRGNTVYISGSIKDGTSTVAFAHYSSNCVLVGNTLSFTIKSTPYSTADAIKNSDVLIKKIAFSFTPVSGAPAFTPTVSSESIGGNVTAGGTWSLSGETVIYPQDFTHIVDAKASLGSIQQYDLYVTFTGKEVNTGTVLITSIPATVYVDIPRSGVCGF
jgi:hypothetical protein